MNKSKPNFYIVPGWGEKITRKSYQTIIDNVKDKYTIIPIVYKSKKNILFSDLLTDCKNQIIEPTQNDVIFGFSVGALIALQLSGIFKFKKSVLSSVSAILEKDLNLYPLNEVEKIFSKEEVSDMNKQKYLKPLSSFVLLCGTLETKELVKRTYKLHKKFDGILVSVADCNHELKGKYLDQVLRQL